MKNVVLLIVALGSLSCADFARAAECFTMKKVRKINMGQVELSLGADGGDAVYFTLDNGRVYPLNKSFNADSRRGRLMASVLQSAFVGDFYVNGYDHHGNTCDDIDEVQILR